MAKKVLGFKPPNLLIERFCNDYSVSETEAIERFEETKKFLILSATNPKVSYSPSKSVDDMWHHFILNTKDYWGFCQHLGCFMHHIPSDKPKLKQYARTKRDLRKMFGKLNEKYWSKNKADCGGGSCDCCPFVETNRA